MHSIIGILFLIASLFWGDWKNWRKYYSTILFFIIGDLLYNFLLNHYLLWEYVPSFDKRWLPNHTFINLFAMLILYPSTVVMYLGNFPEGKSLLKKILYISLWVFIYFSKEVVNLLIFGHFSHSYDWNLLWSLCFDVIIFLILLIHYRYPRIAIVLSVIIIISFWKLFDVPISGMN
ncbi:hypothetical protein LIS82_10065 [Cytobacillus solani]|uniref:CBO0543 family protein n=1 Tax=Cytobacillus solani TaxID=1637975 RepID=UPI0006ABE28C|nr:CBO0543 family protein [Cytobacillus solani]KOP81859.1 hypothetical protein AMS60_04805 [Bacillus sp. FJAT-21945]USK56786.1 hypothetical protein LIS82_10065 [Cytobacillus solani]